MNKDASAEQSDDGPDVGISARTALVLTAVSAIAYAIVFIVFGVASRGTGLALYASFGLSAGLLIVSYVDMRTGLLLDVITLPLAALGIGFALASGAPWHLSLAGAALGYGLVAGLGILWRKIRGYEGIGLGDAKLLAAGGAWGGVGLLPVILLIASGVGIITAAFVSQKTQQSVDKRAIPFGPHLSFGIWVAWCVGDMIPI